MALLQDISLKPFNAFSVDARTRWFLDAAAEEEILALLSSPGSWSKPLFVLGGGSNVLFLGDFPGTVLKVSLRGIEVLDQDERNVYVKAKAGENWDQFVGYCVGNGWGGLENLSLIPGNVGASPVQNIGAYGVELKETLDEVEALDLNTLQKRTFTKDECGLEYRESVFKTSLKDRYLILSVTFRLSKEPELHLDYKDIQKELADNKIIKPSIQTIRDSVIAIRKRKLPDPAVIGNAGSFFKNPTVSPGQYDSLKGRFPGIVAFQRDSGIKLAAAWMIEQCGWKGYRAGDVGVHKDHALVLVNHGNATGDQILELAGKIKASVLDKFGIGLETEVNLVGG